MLVKIPKANQESYAASKYGLTWSQVKDCWNANRSPKTGRRLRTNAPSPLQIKAKKVNWAKLQVKGAAIGMKQAVDQMVMRESEYEDLHMTINKLERLLLNKLTEGYEVTKFEYWQEKASTKK